MEALTPVQVNGRRPIRDEALRFVGAHQQPVWEISDHIRILQDGVIRIGHPGRSQKSWYKMESSSSPIAMWLRDWTITRLIRSSRDSMISAGC